MRLLEVNPDEKTAKLYLKRSVLFMVRSVSKDWQAVETMENT